MAFRCAGRALPARDLAGRQRPSRAAREGRDPDVHVVSESDFAGDPRKVDSRERLRLASSGAAAKRPCWLRKGTRGRCSRCANRWPPTARTRCAPAATPRWTSWGSPWRTSMRSASGEISIRRARGSMRRAVARRRPSSAVRSSFASCSATHSDQFLTTVTEKLLTYALGRGLEASDMPAVRAIKRGAAADNYGSRP